MNNSPTTLVGNIATEPELIETNTTAVINFRLAVDTGTKENPSSAFFNIKAWGQLARNVAESLNKGDRVVVFGRNNEDRWEKDGEKKSKPVVDAYEIGASMRFATTEVTRNPKKEKLDTENF